MNLFDRILDGYTALWRQSPQAVLVLLLSAIGLVLLGCLALSGLSVGLGLAIVICLTAFAWSVGDPDRWPGG